MSANLPDSSIYKHCLIVLFQPPLDKDISISYTESKDIETTTKIKNILINAETNKNINFSIIKNQKEENDNDNDIAYENNIFAIMFSHNIK